VLGVVPGFGECKVMTSESQRREDARKKAKPETTEDTESTE
jgi:hypothetical protein